MSAESDATPLMKQYWELKAKAGDALLLFRMGDFYELFGDDAVEAARILEITLTSRDKNKPNPLPMAGVPYHSIQGYLQKLLQHGKKVAIGEQMEDPAAAASSPGSKSKIVRRDITRIFTPGIQFDLEGSQACYLATALKPDAKGDWTLACLDVSTGEALVSLPLSADALRLELATLPIRHFLKLQDLDVQLAPDALVESLPANYLSAVQAEALLKKHYEAELDAFLPNETAAHALGILVSYALRTQQQERLAHLRLPAPLRRPKSLLLGPRSAEHLDLHELFGLINQTRSALGARQLKRWLLAPLKDPREIGERQALVKSFAAESSATDRISTLLAEVYDLERISGRVNAKLANPRDTLALGRSLATLPRLADLLIGKPGLRKPLQDLAARLQPLADRILKTQRDDAPLVARDGGIFAVGTTPELDRLISLNQDGERFLIELETRERAATGIASLKVRYNRVFGYYIEITSAHLKNVPAHYQRKQTMVGAERFFTEELKKFEEEILTSSVKQKALEQELFEELLRAIQVETPAIMEAARALGELDALVSLSRLAGRSGWSFPAIDDSEALEIRAGRHPLIDRDGRSGFVPNDLSLSPETRLSLVITGPNMGGKSTVMRQTALILILGQMGAPVPALEARWGSVSSVYTRIGAHDAISRGQSTFMVEMSELAHILHHADARSFIVLDEIGRGTSTYDGISVAWATLEWITRQIGARTLFATHYHELIQLASSLPRLANAHMAVESSTGSRGTLRFLYQLKDGPTNESFGVHVARIAGLPKPVVNRAWQVLEQLEKQQGAGVPAVNPDQLSLFSAAQASAGPAAPAPEEPHPVVSELDQLDVNSLTPVQALNFIVKLQEMSRESGSTRA